MTEWNQYKGDPRNTGLRRDLEGPSRVTESWTAELDGRPGSPVCDRDTVYVGTGSGNCYALGAGTGERLWARETESVVGRHHANADRMTAGSVRLGNRHSLSIPYHD